MGSFLVRNHPPRPSARLENPTEGSKPHPQGGRKPQKLQVYGGSQPSRVGAREARAPWNAMNPHKPPVFEVYVLRFTAFLRVVFFFEKHAFFCRTPFYRTPVAVSEELV